ncbi:MAG: TetR/AcrR family transcriptional regulator [Coriobacteriia bacterium]|nr:TetR/AcrR family transcriptional regulator [Coriobacteriia bacterium]
MPRVVDRAARRTELASAASRVFAEHGVSNTSVSDIVKAAGVAQGTFYLYFDSKDDVVLAVVEQLVDRMASAIEAASAAGNASAVERMLGLGDVLSSFERDPGADELIDLLHHADNRALHDRLAENLVPRLIPLVEAIVEQGVVEGSFRVDDTRAAAWFVLGGLQSAELAGTPAAEMPAALAVATKLALRALGYEA